eukprot:TRINITY_DN2203_c0_g1_i5.p2 TRINITY_DN2203_c0_g1~~TRINITY_DN2203_c0_g1_i5.p2  ORF type:complete len:311 (+),score=-16.95 TRINITY_DN2203_c0_g1_i5:857-1789(+)
MYELAFICMSQVQYILSHYKDLTCNYPQLMVSRYFTLLDSQTLWPTFYQLLYGQNMLVIDASILVCVYLYALICMRTRQLQLLFFLIQYILQGATLFVKLLGIVVVQSSHGQIFDHNLDCFCTNKVCMYTCKLCQQEQLPYIRLPSFVRTKYVQAMTICTLSYVSSLSFQTDSNSDWFFKASSLYFPSFLKPLQQSTYIFIHISKNTSTQQVFVRFYLLQQLRLNQLCNIYIAYFLFVLLAQVDLVQVLCNNKLEYGQTQVFVKVFKLSIIFIVLPYPFVCSLFSSLQLFQSQYFLYQNKNTYLSTFFVR